MSDYRHIDSVHLMRGVAAMLVVLEHVVGRPAYPVFNKFFAFADGLGQIGVSAFFVISGLVLPLSLGKDYHWTHLPNFILRRIVRIEPTFLCSALAASLLIFLMTAVAPDGKLWWPSIKQSALHAFYLIPFSKEEWILPVYWTLAVEFQFYLAIGILFSIISRTAKVSPDLAVSLCAAFSLFSYAKHLIPQVQLLKFAPCFALGMVVAGWIIFRCKPATLIVCIVFVVSVAVASALDSKTLIGTVSASAVALFWVRPINRAHFLVKPFWWVGTISYSLYVTHQALASAGENLARLVLRFNDGWIFQVTANLIPLGTIVACFLAAWALYRFVERPTLEFSKKLRSH